MIAYFDNSTTSFPKPQEVITAISDLLTNYNASPGRSGHQFSVRAAREVFDTREIIAQLFNAPSSDKVIFAANATHALNLAFKGLLKKGDHVIISKMEHNSVLRPLRHLEEQGLIEISLVNCSVEGQINIDELKKSFKPNTKLVATLHGSNVAGTLFPVKEIGEICKRNNVLYLVDAAQSAGFTPIDMQNDNIDLLVFTGHKKMLGPTGIGGLVINGDIKINTTIHGGTGSRSENDLHPDFYPDCLEAGTINTTGIIGLKAGIEYLLKNGIENLKEYQLNLTRFFINQLKGIEDVILYGAVANTDRLPLVTMNIKNIVPSDLAFLLDHDYNIMVRAGLHCSPLAHKTIGTFPQGAVRFGIGCFNTEEEIKYAINALKEIIFKHK